MALAIAVTDYNSGATFGIVVSSISLLQAVEAVPPDPNPTSFVKVTAGQITTSYHVTETVADLITAINA